MRWSDFKQVEGMIVRHFHNIYSVNLIPKVSTSIELNWQFHLIQRFDEKKKLLADHDTVLQTITEKLNECQQWQAQHQVKKQIVNLYLALILVTGGLCEPYSQCQTDVLGMKSFHKLCMFVTPFSHTGKYNAAYLWTQRFSRRRQHGLFVWAPFLPDHLLDFFW